MLLATHFQWYLFPEAKPAEAGVEQVFHRRFAAPAVQALSRIKLSSVEKRRRAATRTLREIQSSPELAERLDCGDFSTAFVRAGNTHHSGLSARPTAPLKPAHSKRWRDIRAIHDAREAFWTAPALPPARRDGGWHFANNNHGRQGLSFPALRSRLISVETFAQARSTCFRVTP